MYIFVFWFLFVLLLLVVATHIGQTRAFTYTSVCTGKFANERRIDRFGWEIKYACLHPWRVCLHWTMAKRCLIQYGEAIYVCIYIYILISLKGYLGALPPWTPRICVLGFVFGSESGVFGFPVQHQGDMCNTSVSHCNTRATVVTQVLASAKPEQQVSTKS